MLSLAFLLLVGFGARYIQHERENFRIFNDLCVITINLENSVKNKFVMLAVYGLRLALSGTIMTNILVTSATSVILAPLAQKVRLDIQTRRARRSGNRGKILVHLTYISQAYKKVPNREFYDHFGLYLSVEIYHKHNKAE